MVSTCALRSASGSIALVDEVAGVGEEQRRRERRGRADVDRDDADLSGGDLPEEILERREVEDVAQALAVGLEQDRERAVARRDGEQVGGALALGPERRALAGELARQEQRPARVLAEARGEEGGVAEGADEQILHLVGLRQELLRVGGRLRLRQPQDDAVVGPHGVDAEAELEAAPLGDAGRERRVDAAAERRERQTRWSPTSSTNRSITRVRSLGTSPVAAAWSRTYRTRFEAALVEAVLVRERALGLAVGQRGEAPRRRRWRRPARRCARPGRRARTASCPARPGAGTTSTRSWVISLDAPRRGAEQEDLAARAPRRPSPRRARRRAGRRARRRRCPGRRRRGRGRGWCRALTMASASRPSARTAPLTRSQMMRGRELGELVGGVAPGEHVEHALERSRGQLGEGRRPGARARRARRRASVVHRRRWRRSAGRGRRAGSAGRASPRPRPSRMRARGRGAREQVAAVLREDDAARRAAPPGARRGRCAGARRRPRAAPRSGSPGRPRRCRGPAPATRWRRCTAGRPRLSRSSICGRCSRAIDPWWASAISAPAVSLSAAARRSARRRLFTKIIVERWARTSSTRRGWIARPDRALRRLGGAPRALACAGGLAELGSCPRRAPRCGAPGLAGARVDDGHRPRRQRASPAPSELAAAEQARDLLERPLRGRQADALQRPRRAERSASSRSSDSEEVRPALGRRRARGSRR